MEKQEFKRKRKYIIWKNILMPSLYVRGKHVRSRCIIGKIVKTQFKPSVFGVVSVGA